ncbi:L,D-transpeptidase [Citreimonas salinaria]|uniref:L,D-transpeptidase catalytic domain n=1 Tax=Citreimonas salinaria TaxID=321339 RepID=A0A1H3GVB3_9RHOB|nr:L,D-transpeptidase [Citreimonas salinaria]SDY06444.1 L,D-transpeptidase catalytic domain [Citreimonas salinaria]
MKRRNFILSGLALGGLTTGRPGVAQDSAEVIDPYVVRMAAPYPAPGEVHVLPTRFRLYWTLPEGRALVYPVRVGRGDLYEAGEFFVGAKKEWPSWTPTPGMIEREPEKYARYADTGMPGGPNNPLGARALYLFTPERGDTFLRIHGTGDPATIGRAVSNGCAGLINPHIVDLYERVPMNARVVLHPKAPYEGSAMNG